MPARVRPREKVRRARGEPSAAARATARRWRNLGICLLLAAATFALYLPVTDHDFLNYDDDNYVTRNSHVQAGLTLDTLRWALTSTEADNWHPATWISHALDCQFYGMSAGGHHFTSLLLHVLNVLLLFLLLQAATGATGRSLLVAALFALHPFNVESVAWIAERKNVLSMFFLLLTLGAYGCYIRKPGVKRYLAVAGLFLAGLASKPMVVTLPCALLLLDFWPLDRIQGWGATPQADLKSGKRALSEDTFPQFPFSRLLLEKLPLLLLSAGDSAITMMAQRSGGAMRLLLSPWVKLENAIFAYAMYVWKAFWPTRLAPFYPHPGASLAGWKLALATLFLAAVSTLVWRGRSTRRYLVTGWLWYLGTLIPVIGLVQVGEQAMADRYAYLPLAGIFLMISWGAADLLDRLQVELRWRVLTAAIFLGGLAFLTWRQTEFWESNLALWSHTLDVTGDNYIAEDNLGGALLIRGRAEEAVPHFRNAARINPRDATSRLDIAAVYANTGRTREGIEAYVAALPYVTDRRVLPLVYENLGLLYTNLGDYDHARASYQQALQIDPTRANARASLLQVDLKETMRNLSQHPTAEGYLRLGQLLQQTGRASDARLAYGEALRLNPQLEAARKALDSLNP